MKQNTACETIEAATQTTEISSVNEVEYSQQGRNAAAVIGTGLFACLMLAVNVVQWQNVLDRNLPGSVEFTSYSQVQR